MALKFLKYHHTMSCLAMRERTSPSNVGPSMMRAASMHNESDDDDSDKDDNVVRKNSMQVAAEGDENDRVG